MGLRAWETASDPRIPKQYRWRVRQRWVILEYAATSSLKAAARRFDIDRKTIRLWRQRWQVHGVLGLVPRYPARRKRRVPAEVVELIGYARRELRYGAKRTDFLRQTDLPGADVRHRGLTVAQYGSIVLAGVGIALAMRIRRRAGSPP
jgi:transposase